METNGTLVLTMLVVIPQSLEHDVKVLYKKHVIARFNCVTLDEARVLKSRFFKLNDQLSADDVNGEWTVREYV